MWGERGGGGGVVKLCVKESQVDNGTGMRVSVCVEVVVE